MRFSRIQINNFYNLKDVDLDLSSGSALIVGPNGSGKSNTIKCVHELVKKAMARENNFFGITSTTTTFDRRIWNVGEAWTDTYIKIEASLKRKEAELFYLFHSVTVTHEVAWHAFEISKALSMKAKELLRLDSRGLGYGSRKIFDQEYDDLFHDFNKGMLSLGASQQLAKVVFNQFAVKNDEGDLVIDTVADPIAIPKDKIFEKCIEELYPKLREISNKSPHENQGVSSLQVQLCAVLVGTNKFELNMSFTKDVKLQRDLDAKKKAVVDVLRKIFCDSDIGRFGISARVNGKEESPYDAISFSVEKLFYPRTDVQLSCNGHSMHVSSDKSNDDCGKYTEFSQDLQSLLDRLKTVTDQNIYLYWNRLFDQQQYITKQALVKFLKESLCILPQDRGSGSETDQWTLNFKEVERQLITWKLSEDDIERQSFSTVKNTFKALCGLNIKAVEELKHLVSEEEGASAIVPHPPECRHVRLMATKTPRKRLNEDVIAMRPSEWSGGERECLMVLTAVQMSKADSVFLDEPGNSLHPPQQALLQRVLETQRRPDQTVVTITHALEFMSRLSWRSLYHMSSTGIGFTPFNLTVKSEKEEVVTAQLLPNQVLFKESEKNMLMGPDMRKMFFSTGLYFVEGETDKKVLSALQRFMLDQAWQIRRDSRNHPDLRDLQEAIEFGSWDILSLYGCGNAVKAYKAAKALKIPCAVVLDGDTITVNDETKEEPFTKHRWEKSKLCGALKTQKGSLGEASTLLEDIQSAFEKFEESEMPKKARTILERYGFWIWYGEIEDIIFGNKDAMEEIEKMKKEAGQPTIPDEGATKKQRKKALKEFPEEMMLNIIGACLKSESKNPLDEFLEFMKRHQKQIYSWRINH